MFEAPASRTGHDLILTPPERSGLHPLTTETL